MTHDTHDTDDTETDTETNIDIELTTDDTHPDPVERSPDECKQYDSRSDADFLAADFQRGLHRLRARLTDRDAEYGHRAEDIECHVNGFDAADVRIPTATYSITFDSKMRPALVETALLGDPDDPDDEGPLADVRNLTYERDPDEVVVTATCMQTAFIPEGRRAVSPGGLNFDTSDDTDDAE